MSKSNYIDAFHVDCRVKEDAFKQNFILNPNLSVSVTRLVPLFRSSYNKEYKLIPIQNQAFFSVGNILSEDVLNLPKIYQSLKSLTGYSDGYYDSWKGSFSFMFELEVQKEAKSSAYLLHMFHMRSYIEFDIRQIVDTSEPGSSEAYQSPNDELFSKEDIHYFCNFFTGFLLGYNKTSGKKIEAFFKKSDSNHILFGYYQGEYFYNMIEDPGEYDKEVERYSALIPDDEQCGN